MLHLIKNTFLIVIFFVFPAIRLIDMHNSSENWNLACSTRECYFPSLFLSTGDITIDQEINWERAEDLVIQTKGTIIFSKGGKIIMNGNATLFIKSGMLPGLQDNYNSTVKFEEDCPQIIVKGHGQVFIYYNPNEEDEEHKYHNPTLYDYNVSPDDLLLSYMLVNDIYDLQGVDSFPSGDYALSQDINADISKTWWENAEGFTPIGDKKHPFSGIFDGNGFTIKKLHIKRETQDEVGLFGYVLGSMWFPAKIQNLTLEDFEISGRTHVGALIGEASNVHIFKIKIVNSFVKARGIVGSTIGSLSFPNEGFLKEIASENNLVNQTISITLSNNRIFYNNNDRPIGVCGGLHCDCCVNYSTQIEYCYAQKCLNYHQEIISSATQFDSFIKFYESSEKMFNTTVMLIKIIGRSKIKICMEHLNNTPFEKCPFDNEMIIFPMKGVRKSFLIKSIESIWEEALFH